MIVSKKFRTALISAFALILIIFSVYAYNNLGYTLDNKEAYQVAYQNAGITAKDVLHQSLKKNRLGLKATYYITLKTEKTNYIYTINASTGSIIERKFQDKTS